MKLCAEEKKTFKIKKIFVFVVLFFVFVLLVVVFGSAQDAKKTKTEFSSTM